MAILVDACRWEWRGRLWCHLVSDHSLEELHHFAGGLGIPRAAFQGDHYDIHGDLRELAIEYGAEPVDSRDLVRRIRGAGLRLSPTQRRNGKVWTEAVGRRLQFRLDEATRAVYESSALEYETLRPTTHGARLDQFVGARLPDRPVVDLGCGPGGYLSRLPGGSVGLDVSSAMLRRALEVAPGQFLIQAELEALPFAPGSLGGAWSRNGHVHIPPRRLPWALNQLHRALAVDAPFTISLVPGDSYGPYPNDDLPGRLFAGWSAQRLYDVLVGAGFTVEALTDPAPDNEVPIVAFARKARSLADSVSSAMRVLICGLNPSLVAADQGVGFAGPTNRFWPAAVAAGLVQIPRDPTHALLDAAVGMTDLVKRATPRSSEVTPAEYREGFARINRMVDWLRPGAVCMVGLEGWRIAVNRKATAGWQPELVGTRPVYVMPSTSGLNASSTLADLTEHLRKATQTPERT